MGERPGDRRRAIGAANGPAVRVGVRELRGSLTRYLRAVRHGTSFLVTSRDEVIAEIHPPAASRRAARVPGALRGQIHVDDDFNTLPGDVPAAMER